ncbi:MAG TPA: SHOCT domain-containing protein [Blastocatellia bacterium]|nr:SHOCT domain-containing protein [Blastocatellia bacterium]
MAVNVRRLYAVLAAWCFLLVLPGLLSVLGVFGPVNYPYNVTGPLIASWVVGYLAQFGLFMWIMKIAAKQANLSVGLQMLLWFMASLLPWAVDWSVPTSPLFGLLWLPLLVGAAALIARSIGQEQSLREHGIRALGVVLEVLEPGMNVVVNGVYIKRKVRFRVEREDGVPPYEAILDELFMLGEIPSAGDSFPLLVDPAKPKRIEFDKTAGSDSRQGAKAGATVRAVPRNSYFCETGSVGGQVRASANERGRENIVDELEKLTELRRSGAITDSEFGAAKKKLLRD